MSMLKWWHTSFEAWMEGYLDLTGDRRLVFGPEKLARIELRLAGTGFYRADDERSLYKELQRLRNAPEAGEIIGAALRVMLGLDPTQEQRLDLAPRGPRADARSARYTNAMIAWLSGYFALAADPLRPGFSLEQQDLVRKTLSGDHPVVDVIEGFLAPFQKNQTPVDSMTMGWIRGAIEYAECGAGGLDAEGFVARFLPPGVPNPYALVSDFDRHYPFVATLFDLRVCLDGYINLVSHVTAGNRMGVLGLLDASELALAYVSRATAEDRQRVLVRRPWQEETLQNTLDDIRRFEGGRFAEQEVVERLAAIVELLGSGAQG
jgi:hypothetical protein